MILGCTNFLFLKVPKNVREPLCQEPLWVYPCFFNSFDENMELDSEFFNIKAIDVDYGINSDLVYSITNSTLPGVFELQDKNDGYKALINKEVIDRETLPSPVHTVEITVTETKGCVGCSDSAVTECTIQIIDLNDNKPTFNSTSGYSYLVPEDVRVGEVFTFNPAILVTDADKDPGNNQGEIHFVDEKFNEFFTITPDSILSQGYINIFMSKTEGNTYLGKIHKICNKNFSVHVIKILK